jgi:hypothetical protein
VVGDRKFLELGCVVHRLEKKGFDRGNVVTEYKYPTPISNLNKNPKTA